MVVEIWHNPRCSKSRAALALLQSRGLAPRVRLYLTDPPDQAEIAAMLAVLQQPAAALVRPREGKALLAQPEAEIIAALAADPSLIERPVVRIGKRAIIGRPVESLDDFLAQS